MPSMSMVGMAILLISIAFTFLAVTPVIVAQEVKVRVGAPNEVEEGERFSIKIEVDDMVNLDSGQFDLTFDSNVIIVTDVKEGEIKGEGVPIVRWQFKPGSTDTIRVLFNLPGAEGLNGSGYLAEVLFEVKGEGGDKSDIKISGILFNTEAKEIPAEWINAEIRIGGEEEEEEEEEEPTPTPTVASGVTPTPETNVTVTPSPTPTLAPGETPMPTPTPTLAPGVTPKPTPTPTPTLAPGVTPKPTPTPTPKPAVPGFEAIFAIAVMTLFLFYKKKTCAKRKR